MSNQDHAHLQNRLAETLGGWQGLEGDAAEAFREQEFQAQLDHATIYRQVFGSENGQYVLEDLVRRFLRQRIVRPEDGDSQASGIRQGQADVVQFVLFLIEFANTGGGRPTGTDAATEE